MRRMMAGFILMLLLAPAALLAASKDEIIARQAKRAAEIAELKQQGAIGETDEGYLDSVKGSEGADVVNGENGDRRELYAIIAKETGETAENVAKHAAERHFKRAKQGEYLKYSGKWRKKA